MLRIVRFFLLLLCLCGGLLSNTFAQDNSWLLGEWKGVGIIPGSAYNTVFLRTLTIKMAYKNRWAGILQQEVVDNRNIRIEKEISGTVLKDQMTMNTGRTLLVKQPPKGFWADCRSCQLSSTRITVSSDSLILTNELRLCGNYCDGYSTYYRSLADYDTATQRRLVHVFGSPLLVKIFTPLTPNAKAAGNALSPAPVLAASQATPLPKPANPASDTISSQLSRKNKTIATYNVTNTDIKVELFDNGEIDGDTVTVFHNREIVVNRQGLGTDPIVFKVKADAQNRVHEFTLVANNLGRIPPNTALMRVTAGSAKYELFASTNLKENASVIIIYAGN